MLEAEYQAARLLSAVANSLRFRMVLELGTKPCTPTELAKKLRQSLPRVSYHLALLRRGDAVRFKAHRPRHQLIYWLKHPKLLQLCKGECVERLVGQAPDDAGQTRGFKPLVPVPVSGRSTRRRIKVDSPSGAHYSERLRARAASPTGHLDRERDALPPRACALTERSTAIRGNALAVDRREQWRRAGVRIAHTYILGVIVLATLMAILIAQRAHIFQLGREVVQLEHKRAQLLEDCRKLDAEACGLRSASSLQEALQRLSIQMQPRPVTPERPAPRPAAAPRSTRP